MIVRANQPVNVVPVVKVPTNEEDPAAFLRTALQTVVSRNGQAAIDLGTTRRIPAKQVANIARAHLLLKGVNVQFVGDDSSI